MYISSKQVEPPYIVSYKPKYILYVNIFIKLKKYILSDSPKICIKKIILEALY